MPELIRRLAELSNGARGFRSRCSEALLEVLTPPCNCRRECMAGLLSSSYWSRDSECGAVVGGYSSLWKEEVGEGMDGGVGGRGWLDPAIAGDIAETLNEREFIRRFCSASSRFIWRTFARFTSTS